MNEKTIEEMIANGELGVMSECAYGSAIADTEKNNTLKKDKSDNKNNND